MEKYISTLFFIGLILFISVVKAEDVSNSQDITSVTQNTQEKSSEIGAAKDWSLSDAEWAQYQTLIQVFQQ